jgi:hypothetical protein
MGSESPTSLREDLFSKLFLRAYSRLAQMKRRAGVATEGLRDRLRIDLSCLACLRVHIHHLSRPLGVKAMDVVIL